MTPLLKTVAALTTLSIMTIHVILWLAPTINPGSVLTYTAEHLSKHGIYMTDVRHHIDHPAMIHNTYVNAFSWSPDGQQIVFAAWYRGVITLHLYHMQTRQTELLLSGSTYQDEPSWSPDGSRIAFRNEIGIYAVDVPSRETTQLVSDNNSRYPRWSPDGATLAYSSFRDGGLRVYLLEADSDAPYPITDAPANEVFETFPVFAPDGKQIAYMGWNNSQYDIFLLDVDTRSIRPIITHADSSEVSPAWSNDGEYIAFASSRMGQQDVYLLNLTSGKELRITDDVMQNDYVIWLP